MAHLPADLQATLSSQQEAGAIALYIFMRFPVPGQTKTRLAATIGHDKACRLYKTVASKTVYEAKSLPSPWRPLLYGTGAPAEAFKKCLEADLPFLAQPQGDLTDKLNHCFGHAFDAGASAAVAIGTDCPSINAEIYGVAAEALLNCDAVIGPTLDGGYYLLGCTSSVDYKQIFADIPWSTATVFETTLQRLRAMGHAPHILPMLRDIDTEDDAYALGYLPFTEQETP